MKTLSFQSIATLMEISKQEMDSLRWSRLMSYSPPSSETSVLLRLRQPNGFAELFAYYRETLKKSIASNLSPLVLGRVDASDILQETYLSASRRITDYIKRPAMPFLTWLRILSHQLLISAHRRHLNSQRRSVTRENSSEDFADKLTPDLAANDPVSLATKNEETTILREAIDTLNQSDREILVLRHITEKSNVDAAEELGITPADSQLHCVAQQNELFDRFDV